MRSLSSSRTVVVLAMIGISPCLAAQSPVQEPELFKIVHTVDAPSGKPVPLERQTGQSTVKSRALGLGGVRATFVIDGNDSPIKLKAGERHEFVVRLVSGADPGKYRLYSYQPKDGKRELMQLKVSGLGKAQLNNSEIPFDVSKYGESSYKFAVAKTVAQGQYCYGTIDANEVFCFSLVGPPPTEKR